MKHAVTPWLGIFLITPLYSTLLYFTLLIRDFYGSLTILQPIFTMKYSTPMIRDESLIGGVE